MTKILNGKELAGFIKERQVRQIRGMKKRPKLLIIRDSENPVIEKYVNLKKQYGEDIGAEVEDYLAKNAAEIREKIKAANDDPEIDGIILQLPIAEKEKVEELTGVISAEKDVDGLSGEKSNFDSATATAILWLLGGYDIELKNRKVALVGRGKLVGGPLLRMLKNSGIEVTMLHRGDDLDGLKDFDVIITATGVPGLIKSEMVSPNTVIIDAGTASEKGILRGDVDEKVRERDDLAAMTPRVGGVGPLTVTCLFDHVIQAALRRAK